MKKYYLVIFLLFYCGFSYSQNPCPGTPTVTYAGKIYNTVQIGSQCWLKENLDVGTMINSINGGTNSNGQQTNNGTIEKYCHGNITANCASYGGLYQWKEAMQYVTTEGTQGICPTGWHLPTFVELQTLSAAVGWKGNALKALGQGTGSGAGTNTSGFSALLAGSHNNYNGFYYLGFSSNFWSSTEYGATYGYYLYLYDTECGVNWYEYNKDYGFSVRCAKD
jgi:uncharacterized protein (TIGR02145 family)